MCSKSDKKKTQIARQYGRSDLAGITSITEELIFMSSIPLSFTQVQVNFFMARDGTVMFSNFLKQFCILVQIAIKGPDLLQNRSRKSPDSTWKSFFPPITTYFSTKSRWQNFVAQALWLSQCHKLTLSSIGTKQLRLKFYRIISSIHLKVSQPKNYFVICVV